MDARLFLTQAQLNQMYAHAESMQPEEACGLLGGSEQRVEFVIPIENALHSPVRYRMEANEQLKAFLMLEEKGWDLLGIYHSHPAGPDAPSDTDISEAYYPEVAYLILSARAGRWSCKAFNIRAHEVSQVLLEVS